MKISLIKTNLTIVSKISLAGLFMALVTILQKVVAINYLPLIPFVRISFGGTALIIFSSILLGPFFGLLVGVGSDLLGYFIFDPKTFGFFPQITAIYGLLGFCSYFVFSLIKLIRQYKTMKITLYYSFAILFLLVSIFIISHDEITLYKSTYNIELYQKILIPIILFILFAFLILFLILTDKAVKKKNLDLKMNSYQISFSLFILEMVIIVLFGSIMKASAFGFQTYLIILLSQIIVSFINIPLNTFLISYIMYFTRKYFL